MQSMKGATRILGSMNRSMNLPALQRIAMEFERENEMMDQRQEMMDDAVDDAMGVDDETEGDEVVEQILEEIGVDLRQAVSFCPLSVTLLLIPFRWERRPRVCKAMLFLNLAKLRKQSAEGALVVAETLVMMTFKLD